jgi:hypothetical protein
MKEPQSRRTGSRNEPSRQERTPTMSSRSSFFVTAALALSAVSGLARAAPIHTDESGVPASVDHSDRAPPKRSTNDDINAAEIGNPESPDYRTGWKPSQGDPNAEWQALDAGSPDNPQPGGGSVPEQGSPASQDHAQ